MELDTMKNLIKKYMPGIVVFLCGWRQQIGTTGTRQISC